LVLDWPDATVAITEHGEINWAVDKRGHGTELQKLKEALMDAVKGE